MLTSDLYVVPNIDQLELENIFLFKFIFSENSVGGWSVTVRLLTPTSQVWQSDIDFSKYLPELLYKWSRLSAVEWKIFLNTFLWTCYKLQIDPHSLYWCRIQHQSQNGFRSEITVWKFTGKERIQVQNIQNSSLVLFFLHFSGQILRWSTTRSLVEVQNRW